MEQDRMMNNHNGDNITIPVAQRLLTWCLIVSHLVFIVGCTTTRHVSVTNDQVPTSGKLKILRVVLTNGDIIHFDDAGGMAVQKTADNASSRAIVGRTVEGKVVEIDLSSAIDVQTETKSFNIFGTIILTLAFASVSGAILILATFKM